MLQLQPCAHTLISRAQHQPTVPVYLREVLTSQNNPAKPPTYAFASPHSATDWRLPACRPARIESWPARLIIRTRDGDTALHAPGLDPPDHAHALMRLLTGSASSHRALLSSLLSPPASRLHGYPSLLQAFSWASRGHAFLAFYPPWCLTGHSTGLDASHPRTCYRGYCGRLTTVESS